MDSFDFLGTINIAAVAIAVNNYAKDISGKTLQIYLSQDIIPSTVWSIPVVVQMPAIQGNYPSILLKVVKDSTTLEQINTGL